MFAYLEAAGLINEVEEERSGEERRGPHPGSLLQIVAERSNSFAQGEATAGTTTSEPVWLLINDFSISQTPRAEALQMFQGHKLPCLLYYTQAKLPLPYPLNISVEDNTSCHLFIRKSSF